MNYNVKLVKGAIDEKVPSNKHKKQSINLNMSFTDNEFLLMKKLSGLKGNVEKDQIVKAYLKTKLSYGI